MDTPPASGVFACALDYSFIPAAAATILIREEPMRLPELLRKGTLSVAVWGTAFACGCNEPSQVPQPAKENPQASIATTRQLPDNEIHECVQGSSITLTPSSTFRTSGDLRPFWMVSGAIRNKCDFDLKSVTVRITAYRKGHIEDTLDTADFTVNDVPFHSVRAYKREIQLMNDKSQRFDFTCDFTAATGEFEP